jgi:hypothetical protein
MACSKRRKQVYHLDATQILFAEHNREVSIGVLPEYVSKREAEYNKPFDKNIVFPALELASDTADKSLCPVRALIFYLKATKGHRRGRRRLFLPIPKGREDFRECALTYWVRQLIIMAYADCPDEVAILYRPLHETRAVSISWALYKNVQMSSLLKAAEWKTHNVFINNYMRDMTHYKNGMHILGPMIVAGHQV